MLAGGDTILQRFVDTRLQGLEYVPVSLSVALASSCFDTLCW